MDGTRTNWEGEGGGKRRRRVGNGESKDGGERVKELSKLAENLGNFHTIVHDSFQLEIHWKIYFLGKGKGEKLPNHIFGLFLFSINRASHHHYLDPSVNLYLHTFIISTLHMCMFLIFQICIAQLGKLLAALSGLFLSPAASVRSCRSCFLFCDFIVNLWVAAFSFSNQSQ